MLAFALGIVLLFVIAQLILLCVVSTDYVLYSKNTNEPINKNLILLFVVVVGVLLSVVLITAQFLG